MQNETIQWQDKCNKNAVDFGLIADMSIKHSTSLTISVITMSARSLKLSTFISVASISEECDGHFNPSAETFRNI